MAAGQGFKTFTTGEVLTAGDVNGYLMQGINVFADATARDAAITAPAEGQFAYTKDNNSLWYYTGSAWAASGATGDIEGVTVTSPLTGGGTSGTVTVGIQDASTTQRGSVQLSDSTSTTSSILAATSTAVKNSYDLAAAAIPKSTVTTNGDLIYGTGSSTVTRLGIGSTGQVLSVSGGVPAWTTPATSGFVGCSIYGNRTTTLSNGGTTYAIAFNTEYFDTDNFHDNSTNNTRVTIPTGKSGKYQINVQLAYDNATGTPGYIQWFMRIDGSGSFSYVTAQLQGTTNGGVSAGNNNNTILSGSMIVSLNAGQYFEILSRTDNGNGNLSCSPYLTISYLGA